MEKDLISVLIPAYNVQKYLGRCLRSVLKQTYQNLEIVVVDDGSTDQTYEVAKKFAEQDHRIVLLQKVNENNVATARNYLLDHCHGKYCVWVDSDDCVKAQYVEKLYQALISHQADMSICRHTIRVFPMPILPSVHRAEHEYVGDQMIPRVLYRTAFTLWNKMYRMDLINGADQVRFDPKYCYDEDLLFNLKYLQRCQKIVHISERLYHYFWRAGSETHKKFSESRVNLVNRLMELCANETNPVVRDALCGWTAFSCCGSVYIANKRRYSELVDRMKDFAYQNREHLFKNHLAKPLVKCILWLGLKTWCRPKKKTTREH